MGIGPGDKNLWTQQARQALDSCQLIVGYEGYLRLLDSLREEKTVASFKMTEEVKRAQYAIDKAREGYTVCVVSGGDPGIYGMAGVVLGLLKKEDKEVLKVEVIPAISAASACASLLGAPLMHDFVTISLSDRLTDANLINKRVTLAAQGDFVIVLYNPKSKRRKGPFDNACRILFAHRSPHTPVGIVRKAYRPGQEVEITTLQDLPLKNIDMVTTITVGNSQTYIKDFYMITPRGYKE